MKRIALLVCGLVLLVANTAEARRQRWIGRRNNTRPVAAAPVAHTALRPISVAAAADSSIATADNAAESADADDIAADASATDTTAAATTAAAAVTTASYSTAATTARAVSYSTSTAQGVANLMAAYNRVGHFGGNPGYEGCGCGATPAAAYAICCYANSGMATVDVGYARGANGMWYCCRRYR